MTSDELYEQFETSFSSLMTRDMLIKMADRSNDMHGFNFLNKMFIYMQNKYASSVKSEYSWNAVGREVCDKATPIWTVENVSSTEYTDAETGKTIDVTGLSVTEVNNAIKFGIINKSKSIIGLKVEPVYNIKDTSIIDKQLYSKYAKSSLTSTKLSRILDILYKVYGIKIVKGSSTSQYKYDNKAILIGDDDLSGKLDAIGYALFDTSNIVEYLENSVNEQELKPDMAIAIRNICRQFIVESIKSAIEADYFIDGAEFSKIDTISDRDEQTVLLKCLSEVNDIVEEFLDRLHPENSGISDIKLRKAEELLNILEANAAITHLKEGVM